jgi:hypothetical protein
MITKQAAGKMVVAGCLLAVFHCASYAVDSASIEVASGNQTKIVRVGAQWKWETQWWKSNGTHIGGYWDFTIAQWRGNRFQNVPGARQRLTSIGVTPVFRFQRNSLKGPYAEAGIGANYLSELYDNNDQRFSTKFQFGDHLGVGYVFQSNVDVGLKIQHFSNGGIKNPNPGVNVAVIRVSYPF